MPFDLVVPRSPEEALALLDPEDPSVRPISGGTALMLMVKSGLYRPSRLISLARLGGNWAQIRPTAEGGLRIGAMVRLRDLERSPEVARVAPAIAQTLRRHSNVRVRNVATVGGNLAHADPHLDLPPVLIALGAHVETAAPGGRRHIAVEELNAGYMETVLAANELIAELVIPPPAGKRAFYVKCTTRAADDWPALGVAVALAGTADRIGEARVVIGAATERPLRLAAAERVLQGSRLDETVLREAGRAAAEEAEVVADERGSAAYKKALVAVHVRRAIAGALAQ
jgi:aerobic carbon-monoxide dehydrogenase medium subunit